MCDCPVCLYDGTILLWVGMGIDVDKSELSTWGGHITWQGAAWDVMNASVPARWIYRSA